MASSEASNHGSAARSWPVAEKRRIVELTLREGASISEIARAHGLHYNSVSRWRALYRSGKLKAPSRPAPQVPTPAASAALLPVTISSGVRAARLAAPSPTARGREISIVQLTLPSGATFRLECGELDAALVSVLLAEAR